MSVQKPACHIVLPLEVPWMLLVTLVAGTLAAEPEAKPPSGSQPSVEHSAPSQAAGEPTKTPDRDTTDWHKLGRECLERGESAEAIAAFDQAIAEAPKHADSYYFRARAKERLHRMQEAIDDYGQAIRLRSNWGSARLRLGNLLVRIGKTKQGLSEQKKALGLGTLDDHGLEFIYIEPSSSAEFRFVYVPPGEGVVGYDEEVRLKMAKQSLQPFFGHNATPAQRVRIQQGFFLLDREMTIAQYKALAPKSDNRLIGVGPAKGSKAPLAPAAKTGKATGSPRAKSGKIPADTSRHHEPSLELIGDTPQEAAPLSAGKTKTPKPSNQLESAADRPASSVSWHEANSFCSSLQARLGLIVRLPSEIEWEYAARGNSTRLYPWKDEGFHAWAEHPEASPQPSAPQSQDVSWVGAYDMAGNVSEWCLDTYRQSLFDKPSAILLYTPSNPASLATTSTGSKPPPERTHKKPGPARSAKPGEQEAKPQSRTADQNSVAVTYRGGSYRDNRLNCQSPVRRSAIATQQDPTIGFRPVLLLKAAQ